MDKQKQKTTLHQVDDQEDILEQEFPRRTIWIVYGVLIVIGILTGYVLSGQKSLAPGTGRGAASVGISDTRIFKDSSQGIIQKGGIDGEGTHSLIREGGPSQTAYLISSVVDMDMYVGKKVKVWGQTIAAKKAAWLMDVGKIELLSE